MTPLRTVGLLAVMLGATPLASAQSGNGTGPGIPASPLVVMIPNYNSVPVGEIGSLQAGAYLARVRDSSATWFNPAGLARADTSSVSGSAGAFQIVSAWPEGLRGTGSSFQQMPAAVGVVAKNPLGLERWTGGFQVTRTGTWDLTADVSREFDVAAGVNRLTYSSDASFHGFIASAAAGYEVNPRLRLGLSIDGQLTEWSLDVSSADEYRTGSSLGAVLFEGHGTASAVDLRLTAGLQYELSSTLRVGAVFRTPGITLWTSGSKYQNGVATAGSTTISTSLFEPSGEVTFKLPAEVKAGAAYVGKRAQVELDVMAYSGTGTYNAFRSTQPFLVVRDPGRGDAPTRQEVQPDPMTVNGQSVVNIAVGGQVGVTANGLLKIHAGFSTDRSPVGPADTQFTKVDMQTWTVGLSGSRGPVLGSLGIRYEWGLSDPISVVRLQSGAVYTTNIRVRNVGIVYSFAFKF